MRKISVGHDFTGNGGAFKLVAHGPLQTYKHVCLSHMIIFHLRQLLKIGSLHIRKSDPPTLGQVFMWQSLVGARFRWTGPPNLPPTHSWCAQCCRQPALGSNGVPHWPLLAQPLLAGMAYGQALWSPLSHSVTLESLSHLLVNRMAVGTLRFFDFNWSWVNPTSK